MSTAWHKRLARDLAELKASGYAVTDDEGSETTALDCFCVELNGPEGTPYHGFKWRVRFTVGPTFPFASPSVGFVQHILHPNVDWSSGSVCLDALNSKWSPVFTLKHIVESLLPYLLAYPNPEDPLNRNAAALLREAPAEYMASAAEQAKRHALKI